MTLEREIPVVPKRTFGGVSAAVALLAAGLLGAPAQAQEQEETPLISPDELALLRAEPLEGPGEVTATPERLFLGNCATCHGTSKVGNGEPERLTRVILHGVDRGERGNISMPGFEEAVTDEQVAKLVAFLSEARTGTSVEVSVQSVAEARAGQEALLKPLEE